MFDPNIMEAAIAWHVRRRDMAEDGWQAFVAWLEASPAHAGAYDVVAGEDDLIVAAFAALPTPALPTTALPTTALPLTVPMVRAIVPRAIRPTHRRWGWLAGAGAIAATLAVVVGPLTTRGARPYAVETRPGEHRTLALADGTQVAMDGGTRLRLDRADPRVAGLERGQALFRVTHDGAHPFVLRSGAVTIRDLGTVFDVTRSGTRLDVAVAEGSVLFRPDGVASASAAVTLTAGRKLSLDEAQARVLLGSVTPADVGGWRQDRLSFEGEPLAGVVAAIERRYGTRISLSAGLPDRPFTGMIALSGSAERDIPHLAALIGADWRHERGQWTFASRDAEADRTR